MRSTAFEGAATERQVRFLVPTDLFDVMLPTDPHQAAIEYRDLFGRMMPRAGAQDIAILCDGILAWRRHLLDAGVLLHGLVAVPSGGEVEAPAHWHIFAGVVDVPQHPDVDVSAVAARYFGAQLDPAKCYLEEFDTVGGWGVGLITEVPLAPLPGDVSAWHDQQAAGDGTHRPVLGLSAAVSADRQAAHGVLVVGICLDVEHTLEMSAIVATIAGGSTVTHPSEEAR